MNLQVHTKDRSNGAGLSVKGNLEIGDFQERRRCVGQGVTSLQRFAQLGVEHVAQAVANEL